MVCQLEGTKDFTCIVTYGCGVLYIYSRRHGKVPVPFACNRASVSVQRNPNGDTTVRSVPFRFVPVPFYLADIIPSKNSEHVSSQKRCPSLCFPLLSVLHRSVALWFASTECTE